MSYIVKVPLLAGFNYRSILMRLRFLALFLFFFFALSPLFAASVLGFWKTIDDESGLKRSIVAVYEYEGKVFGRIVLTFDEQERVKDTIYRPAARAEKLPQQPYMAGLDIIWDMQEDAAKARWHKGKILDPKKGKVYNSELSWNQERQCLQVRGKIGPFGRNQFWLKTVAEDFPEDFTMPDCREWTPKIPAL